MENTDETYGLFFGTDKMQRLEKAFSELDSLDKKYENEFKDGDQLSFYYTIHYTNNVRLVWQKGAPSEKMKMEILEIMDRHFR